MGYTTKSAGEIFTKRSIDNAMSPNGVMLRESRDSEEHPLSVPVILALDVTGSMGMIPHQLVKEGLPHMMAGIIEHGVQHPQVLFLAIGDHKTDDAPLQVGQFESNDELLDKWLTNVYLEGHGGGNGGESYALAWYFAGYRTSTDSFEKRKTKGFLFTVGDEPVHNQISRHDMKQIMGEGEYGDYTAAALLAKARETYHVFHLHIKETMTGMEPRVINGWKEIMGENLIIVESHDQIANIIAETVVKYTKDAMPTQDVSQSVNTVEVDNSKPSSSEYKPNDDIQML